MGKCCTKMEHFNEHARVCNCCFIPTKEGARNRHFNCFVNIHSIIVFIVVGLGLIAGSLMYTRMDGMLVTAVQQLKNEIQYFADLSSLDGNLADLNNLDEKTQEYILNAPDTLKEEMVARIKSEMPGVDTFTCNGVPIEISVEGIWANGDPDATKQNMSCAMNELGMRRRLTEEDRLGNRILLSPIHEHRRLQANGGLPDQETINQFGDYSKYGKYAVVTLALLGPFFLMLAMIGLCCSLKYLANHIEGTCESCCGTVNGCFTFPLLHILSLVFAVLALIIVVLLASMLSDPHKMIFKVLDIQSKPFSIDLMWTELVKLSDAGWKAMQGEMCDDSGWIVKFVLVPENEDVEAKTGTPKKEWCNNWVQAYQFCVVELLLCSVCASFGIFISFYLGYKACCRNKRGNTGAQNPYI